MAYAHIQQPTTNPGMSVGGGNRNPKNLPVSADGREWSGGLLECFGDAGTCILASFCPCIVYSNVKHRYERLNNTGHPNPKHGGGGDVCTTDCMTYACVSLCGFCGILQTIQRRSIRARYNIKGAEAGDCCAASCCGPCALTQESRELELEERSLGLGSAYGGNAYGMLSSSES